MKKSIILVIIFLLLLGVGSAGISYVYFGNKQWDQFMYPGVVIENQDVSGKNLTEAKQIIEEKFGNAILQKKVNIIAKDKTYTIDYAKLNAKYNIDEIVQQAFQYGKKLNILSKYKILKNPVRTEFQLKFTYDDKPVEDIVKTMEQDINKDPVKASISMPQRGQFVVIPDKKGAKLKSEELKKAIIEKINGELDAASVDVQAPVEILSAAVTAEQLNTVNTRVSSFSTNYSTSIDNRKTNIGLATRAINGTLIMPGGTFSFNGIVGQRTAAKGYKEAGVIIGNQLDSGIGGGICQVSSTLYNAMLRSNIKPVERSHHTLPLGYIGLGLDATVDYGNLDYKFKNTLKYPIYIEGTADGDTVNFNIYSNNDLLKRTYDITTEVYETIQPNTKYIDDPTKYEGDLEIVQKATIGHRVRVFKDTYENGTLVNHELISNDLYKPVDGQVKRGTKKR